MDRISLPNGNGTVDHATDGNAPSPTAPSTATTSSLPVAEGAPLTGGIIFRRYVVRIKVRTTHPFHGRHWVGQDYLVRVQGNVPADLPDVPDAVRRILHRVAVGELAGSFGAFVWVADPADLA